MPNCSRGEKKNISENNQFGATQFIHLWNIIATIVLELRDMVAIIIKDIIDIIFINY